MYINKLFDPPPVPPHKYLITEAKFNTATLNRTVTKSRGSQMQYKWIEHSLKNMLDDELLIIDIKEFGYDAVLTTIKKDGSLKNMKLLDKNAKKIKNFN